MEGSSDGVCRWLVSITCASNDDFDIEILFVFAVHPGFSFIRVFPWTVFLIGLSPSHVMRIVSFEFWEMNQVLASIRVTSKKIVVKSASQDVFIFSRWFVKRAYMQEFAAPLRRLVWGQKYFLPSRLQELSSDAVMGMYDVLLLSMAMYSALGVT